jgi:hypothetical protein
MVERAVEDDLDGRGDEHERARARKRQRPSRAAPRGDADLGVRSDAHAHGTELEGPV